MADVMGSVLYILADHVSKSKRILPGTHWRFLWRRIFMILTADYDENIITSEIHILSLENPRMNKILNFMSN